MTHAIAHDKPVFARRPPTADGMIHTVAGALAPGGYEIRVTGTHPGSPVTPVTAQLLVWDPTGTLA